MDCAAKPSIQWYFVSAYVSALIAIAGTLLGTGVTYLFQRSSADRAADHAVAERLRQDRLNAYNTFADAAVEYRRTEIDRWHRLQDGSQEAEVATRVESYAKRTEARSALLRVRLLTNDVQLQELGEKIMEITHAIHRAGDSGAKNERGDKSMALIDAFVQHAGREIQSPSRALTRVSR